MSAHRPSLPCALGRVTPPSPANRDELRAMRAAAWHKQGIVVVPLDEIYDEWERAFLIGIATRLYGARSPKTQRDMEDER